MTSPLELLAARDDWEPPLLSKYWGPIICSSIGFGGACFVNYGLSRPLFTGVQRHIAFTIIGGLIGSWLETKRTNYYNKRDAVFRHYIELHPEDFPTPPRQKYSEVLNPWFPVR